MGNNTLDELNDDPNRIDITKTPLLDRPLRSGSGSKYIQLFTTTEEKIIPFCTIFSRSENGKICIKSGDLSIDTIVEIDPKDFPSNVVHIGKGSPVFPDGFFGEALPFVSRRHCSLTYTFDAKTGDIIASIYDTGSTNKTLAKELSSSPWSQTPTIKLQTFTPENLTRSESVRPMNKGDSEGLPLELDGRKCTYSIFDINDPLNPIASVYVSARGVHVHCDNKTHEIHPLGEAIRLGSKPENLQATTFSMIRGIIDKIVSWGKEKGIVVKFEKSGNADNATINNLSDKTIVVTIHTDER